MNAKINTIEFQLATLEEAKANDHSVQLYHSFSTDYDRFDSTRLELVDGDQWQAVRTLTATAGPVAVHTVTLPAYSCFLTMSLSNGRRLVVGKSQEILWQAVNDAGVFASGGPNENLHGFIMRGHFRAGMDHSPLGYSGEFDFSGTDLCEFLPAGKPSLEHKDGSGSYKGFHQQQKIGKGVRYVLDCLGYQYTDQQIEKAVNIIKAQNSPLEIKLAKETGYSISELYDTHAADHSGTLLDSCMRGHGDFYFDLDQCDNADLAYCLNHDGELVGRALVWTDLDGRRFMDRIYGQDKTVQAFKNYARENGMYHKQYQTYDSRRDWVTPEGNDMTANVTISINMLDSIDNEQAPYMDTFSFYEPDNGILTNSSAEANSWGDDGYELRNTDGTADRYTF